MPNIPTIWTVKCPTYQFTAIQQNSYICAKQQKMVQICLLSTPNLAPLKKELIELTHAIMVASGIPHTTPKPSLRYTHIRIQLTLEKVPRNVVSFVCLFAVAVFLELVTIRSFIIHLMRKVKREI